MLNTANQLCKLALLANNQYQIDIFFRPRRIKISFSLFSIISDLDHHAEEVHLDVTEGEATLEVEAQAGADPGADQGAEGDPEAEGVQGVTPGARGKTAIYPMVLLINMFVFICLRSFLIIYYSYVTAIIWLYSKLRTCSIYYLIIGPSLNLVLIQLKCCFRIPSIILSQN